MLFDAANFWSSSLPSICSGMWPLMLFIVHQEILDASIYQFQRVCFHLSGSSLEAEREFQANLAMKGWSQKENLKTNQVFEEQ